jgi:hypothetical protein
MSTTAEFHCAVCQTLAAKITLNNDDWLITEGFLGEVKERISTERGLALQWALEDESAFHLYGLERLWAPFYCPECDAVYCKDHWRMQMEFEDDPLPGWYDCTWGTCPHGHRRMVDD